MEAMGQDVASQLSSLTVSNNTIHQISQGSQSQLARLQSDFVSLKTTLLTDQNSNGRQQLHTSIKEAHTDMLNDHRQGRDIIMTAITHESLHTQAELASLRDVLLEFMTGNTSSIDVDRSIVSQLTDGGNADLATQIGEQLIMTPSSLKDVCERTTLENEPIEWNIDRRRRVKKNECICTCVRKHFVRRIGPFGIADDFRAAHATKCSKHRSHWGSWSYSFSVQLLPIVQRTVEITFGTTFGAGGSSIGTSLRYFGTVERLKSPAFQLFDDFPDRCACRSYCNGRDMDEPYMHLLEDSQFVQIEVQGDYSKFYFDWDLKLLEAEIPELCRELSRLLSTGRSSASYSDQYGNTILHVSFHKLFFNRFTQLNLNPKAIFALIGLLGSYFYHFRDQLKNLAEFVIDAGVQVQATSRRLAIDYGSDFTM